MTDTIPFTVSDNAAKRIAFLLSDEPDGTRFRVAVLGGGCSGFQYHFTLDNETLGSAGFELKNPQAASSCGCGNSFSIA
jgi:iron-sulfur cluster insertion protein